MKSRIPHILVITILIAFGLGGFSGCGQSEKTPEELAAEEKANFISANVELTCEILKNPSLTVLDVQKREEFAKEIFSKYGFDVENDDEMLSILDKYENDQEVLASVKTRLEAECEIEIPSE